MSNVDSAETKPVREGSTMPIPSTGAKLWVGERRSSGSTWVFDPEIEHDDSDMVYAFWVTPERMQEYSRQQLRSVLVPVQGGRRDRAISTYLRWKGEHGGAFIEKERLQAPGRRLAAEERRRTHAEAEELRTKQRQDEASRRHRLHLEKYGIADQGLKEGAGLEIRFTHCYSCKQSLDSSIHLQCNACRWIVCYCGACGCGYTAERE